MQELCKLARSRKSRLYIYLAPTEEKGTCFVAADIRTLESVGRLVKLECRMIKPCNCGLFHAKEIAIRRGGSWCLVTGSPNATSAAMVSPNGNIETALCREHRGSALPKSFLPKWEKVSLAEVRSLPRVQKESVWDALDLAVYDVRSGKLKLDWREGHGWEDTEVLFDGKRVANGRFVPGDSHSRALQTRPRAAQSKPKIPGFCPIIWQDDIPDVLPFCPQEMSPDDWLERLLGAVNASPMNEWGEVERPALSPATGATRQDVNFAWSDRVKRLDSSLGSLAEQLNTCPTVPRIKLLLRDAVGTWTAHDPRSKGITASDIAWRKWVRAGLWQVLDKTPGKPKVIRVAREQAKAWSRSIQIKLKEYPIAPQ